MRLLTIQEAYQRKFDRQKRLKGIEFHAGGHCAHIGKMSPGCQSCFVPDPFKRNITAGVKCNLNCVYCPEDRKMPEPPRIARMKLKAALYREAHSPHYAPMGMSFSGGGEPLLYLDVIAEYMKVFQEIEREAGKRPWFHLYTNGILAKEEVLLRLRDMGFDEIRFHLGASNFSPTVYRNMKKATGLFRAVSVETPAWPPHRHKLFEMLPRIDDFGVRHLNVGEIEVNPNNYRRIAKILPEGKIYPCLEVHLDDGGLVYDLMEEVLRRGYSFSVLDCNCFVKSIQRRPAHFVFHDDLRGVIAEY